MLTTISARSIFFLFFKLHNSQIYIYVVKNLYNLQISLLKWKKTNITIIETIKFDMFSNFEIPTMFQGLASFSMHGRLGAISLLPGVVEN